MSSDLVQRPVISVDTEVSQYERVSSGLSAGVIIVGLLAGVMFFIWYSMLKNDRVVVTPIPALAGETSNPEGVAEDIEEPGVEEFPEVAEPMLAEALEAVDVASTVRANDSVAGNAPFMGTGKGLGDSREKGFGTGGNDRNEPWKRWEIDFKVTSIPEYAKQLDHFKIELGGAEKKGDSVVYCLNVSSSPMLRQGLKRSEKRIYFQHSKPILRKWDLQILQKAGLQDSADRTPIQFYPAEIIQQMYALEAAQLQQDGRTVPQIKKTYFAVEATGGSYQFVLKEMKYLN